MLAELLATPPEDQPHRVGAEEPCWMHPFLEIGRWAPAAVASLLYRGLKTLRDILGGERPRGRPVRDEAIGWVVWSTLHPKEGSAMADQPNATGESSEVGELTGTSAWWSAGDLLRCSRGWKWSRHQQGYNAAWSSPRS